MIRHRPSAISGLRLLRDDDGPLHVAVAGAAEDVAEEGKRARLAWRQLDAHRLARRDIGMQVEIRRAEAVQAIERGQLEHYRLALLQRHRRRIVLELLDRDLDDLRRLRRAVEYDPARDETGQHRRRTDPKRASAIPHGLASFIRKVGPGSPVSAKHRRFGNVALPIVVLENSW